VRQPEGVEIAGQPHDEYLTGPEAMAPTTARFALNWTA
jgi:hypothetical protein